MIEEIKLAVDIDDSGLNSLSNSSTGAGDSLKETRKSIKALKDELLNLKEGTEEYNIALAKLAEQQFKIKDINDKARASVSDFGELSKNLAGTLGGLAGAFGVVEGSMQLMGIQNESV